MIRRRADSGQTTVFVLLAMPVILGMVGLAIDVGYLRATKRQMQTAADSGAIAGALAVNDATSDYARLAKSAAGADGFTDGTNGVTVTVNKPPSYGPHANDATGYYVETIITQSKSAMFAAILGVGPLGVAARAVAWGGANGRSCAYALSPTALTGIFVGGTNLAATCGMMADSNSASAMKITGSNASFPFAGVVGGYSISGSNISSPGGGTPTEATGIPVVSNPLAYLNGYEPAVCSGGTSLNISGVNSGLVTPGNNCYNVSISGSNNVILNPGQYSSITISGSNGTTFNPGLYSISGSVNGRALNFGGANVTVNGVTFYLGPSAGAVDVSGSNSSFTAPTTGTYAGILFFQNPSDTNAATIGGSNSTVVGALYFPKARLTFNGSNATSAYTILVANTVVFSGSNATVNNNYATLSGGSPIHTAVLVE